MPSMNPDLLTELLHLPKPWIITGWQLDPVRRVLTVQVAWPAEVAVRCPDCKAACIVHDHREPRHWRHLPCMEYQTWLVCRLPRARCEAHGVRTVAVPWAEPLARMTLSFEAHCILTMQSCQTMTAAQRLLCVGEAELYSVRRRAVERGLSRRDLSGIEHVGLDEKSFLKGQSYVTALSDLDRSRVLEVVESRTQEAAEQALKAIPESARSGVVAAAMDMHQPYQMAVNNVLPKADIVHDRYHIKAHLNEAVNKVRRAEHKALVADGDKSLAGTRYVFLRNPENWSEQEALCFDDLAAMQLKVTRAWWLKELFDDLYTYRSLAWARRFFAKWFFRATHSHLEPIRKAAWMLKRHFENIVTYIKHGITNAVAEGLNSKIQVIKSAARGFRNFHNYRIAILFHCGALDLFPTL